MKEYKTPVIIYIKTLNLITAKIQIYLETISSSLDSVEDNLDY